MKPSYELREQVAWIRLDDGKANALRLENLQLLDQCLDRADADRATAIVFRGRDGMFSGGLDIKWLPTLDGPGLVELMHVFSGVMLRILASPRPTVALVSGHAVAGGCILACACDRRIGLRGPYRMQMNEVLVRMAMPSWAALIVSSAVPVPKLYDVLQLAVPFDFEAASEWGTLHALADSPEQLDSLGQAAAAQLGQLDANAFGATKRVLWAQAIERVKADLPGG